MYRRYSLGDIKNICLPGLNADQPSRSGYMVTYNDQLCERLTSGVNTFVFANGRSYIRLGKKSFILLFKQHEYAS